MPEADGLPHEKLTGWKGDFWKRLDPPADSVHDLARPDALAVRAGREVQYSNPGIAMLSYVVTAAIKDGPHKDIRTLLRERVMRPIGAPDDEWSVGYGKTYTVDGLPLVASWGGGNYTARAGPAWAGLMLRQGDWDGTAAPQPGGRPPASPPTPARPATAAWAGGPTPSGRYARLPEDAFWAPGPATRCCWSFPA